MSIQHTFVQSGNLSQVATNITFQHLRFHYKTVKYVVTSPLNFPASYWFMPFITNFMISCWKCSSLITILIIITIKLLILCVSAPIPFFGIFPCTWLNFILVVVEVAATQSTMQTADCLAEISAVGFQLLKFEISFSDYKTKARFRSISLNK